MQNPTGNCQAQSMVMMENVLYVLQNIATNTNDDKKLIGKLFLQMLKELMATYVIAMKPLFIVDVRYAYKDSLKAYFNVIMLNQYTSSNNSDMYLGLIKV